MSDGADDTQNTQKNKIHELVNELVRLISQKIYITKQVNDKQLTGQLVDGVTRLSMKNGASTTFKDFERELNEQLTDKLLSGLFNDDDIYDNFVEFVNNMGVEMMVGGDLKPYCMITLHDTIGKYTPSESTGTRCTALKYFWNVMKWIVKYIKDDSHKNNSDKTFNYSARFKLGGSFVKSFQSCGLGSFTNTGGSKSRRTHRRKHARKTHHKHARKTRHKRGGRRSRSYTKHARKTKSHKRRK